MIQTQNAPREQQRMLSFRRICFLAGPLRFHLVVGVSVPSVGEFFPSPVGAWPCHSARQEVSPSPRRVFRSEYPPASGAAPLDMLYLRDGDLGQSRPGSGQKEFWVPGFV